MSSRFLCVGLALLMAVGGVVLCPASTGRASPTPQFSIAGPIATDLRTGLEWQRSEIAGGPFTHANAVGACAAMGAPWRLPTALELLSIVDETRSGNMHDPTVFPGATAAPFWTSSSPTGTLYYLVDMYDGSTITMDAMTVNGYTRCVR